MVKSGPENGWSIKKYPGVFFFLQGVSKKSPDGDVFPENCITVEKQGPQSI